MFPKYQARYSQATIRLIEYLKEPDQRDRCEGLHSLFYDLLDIHDTD